MQTPQQFFKSRNIALLGQQHHQNFVLIDRTHHYKECGNASECSNRILIICSTIDFRTPTCTMWTLYGRSGGPSCHCAEGLGTV
jgi:hypothetical protein